MDEALSIGRAKARFAECVRYAERGGTIVLTRHGRPVARLSPLEAGTMERRRRGSTGISGEVREAAGPCSVDQNLPVLPSAPESRLEALQRLLEEDIWPRVPDDQLDVALEKREREKILGYGRDGV